MNGMRELLGVSWSGLTARRTRTFLIMLGPIVGVAAMVGAVGLTESAKGDLKQKLAELGTSLVIATPGSAFGDQTPTFPEDAVDRVMAVPTVEDAAATSELAGVIALPSEGSADHFAAFPVPVKAADLDLPSVLQVPVITGRWLTQADTDNETRAVVLGPGLAPE
jgi:putative ABC transport system permease protein